MKKLVGFLALLVSVSVLISSCDKTDEIIPGKTGTTTAIQKDLKNGINYCGDPKIVPLIAGKTNPVGEVVIGNDYYNFYVTIMVAEPWKLTEFHLFIGPEEDIPMTKKGNVIPGQFPYKEYFNPGVSAYTFVILKENLEACFTLSLHSVVTVLQGDLVVNETAWAGLAVNFEKPNWGWFEEICLCTYPDHVVIFRNNIPWGPADAQLQVLSSLGFTEGTGHKQYTIYPSSSMASAVLNPGVDLVILTNDQYQNFYDDYALNHEVFETFLNDGGHLLWEACDVGWHYGSMATAGIVLPLGIMPNEWLAVWNWIVNPVGLLEGLPDAMDHNYASHEWFLIPDGVTPTIYLKDENGPTLLEVSVGDGFMMLSGQPMEHQFIYQWGVYDLESLLPRILSYFTGVPLPPMMKGAKAVAEGEVKPSHID